MRLYRAGDGILDLSKIGKTKVLLAGMGSAGSLTVANLAYPWREVVLVDPDNFEIENLERHLLGRQDLNQPKVVGVQRWLEDKGVPAKKIVAHHGVVEDILDQHTDADLVIVAVDKRRVRDIINAWCFQHGIPAMYIGIYPKGVGGHIMVVPTPQEVCYQCAEFMMGGETPSEEKKVTDYGIDIGELLDDAGDISGVSALRAPINAIATDMATLALEFIREGEITPQVFIRTFSAWEDVAAFNQNDPFIPAHESYQEMFRQRTIFLPAQQVRKEGGVATLSLRHSTVAMRLRRWPMCPRHQASISMDDI